MFAPSLTTHPLQLMAEQLMHASAQRDSRVLNSWLCGTGLPRLSREGELPHEVLWELLHYWWQPDPEQLSAFMNLVCDSLDACRSAADGQVVSIANGTNGQTANFLSRGEFGQPVVEDADWPDYCRSLFALCALLPQHEGVFDRLAALDSVGALGSVALLHPGVMQSLQRSLIEQQTDDRLLAKRWQADFELAIGQIGANQWSEPIALLVTAWRAMVLACAGESVGQFINRPEIVDALVRTEDLATQFPQHDTAVDALLAQLLAHGQLVQGGTNVVWCAAVQQGLLPDRVKGAARDLWPLTGGVDAWVAAIPSLQAGWRKLGRPGREAVRHCVTQASPQELADLQFSWAQARLTNEWTGEMVKLLRDRLPALRGSVLDSVNYRQLQADDHGADPIPSAGPEQFAGARSNHARFVATQNSLNDIARQLTRRQHESAKRRAYELLSRQGQDGTPTALQSKTAASLATMFAEATHLLEAKELWQRAIELNTEDSVASSGLAEVLKELGDLPGSRSLYEEILQAHPQNVVARNGLAAVIKEMGDLPAARTLYESTVQSYPQNVFARNGLANVLKELGSLQEARVMYESTLQSHPQDLFARGGLANVLRESGDLFAARALYENTLQSHPQDVFARAGLANVLRELGDLPAARALYQATHLSHPQNVLASNGLANVLKELGEFAAARTLYETTLQSNPQNVFARNGLAEVFKELGNFPAARATYESTLQIHPQNVFVRTGLANVLRDLGDLPAARALFEEILQSYPQNVAARSGLAEVLKEQGNLRAARAMYENTLQTHPANVVVRSGLANVLKELGELDAARAHYEDMLLSHPQDVVARNGLANVLKELGDLAGARVRYEDTLKSHPRDLFASCGLANVLKELGDLPAARALYEKTLQAHPQNVVARNGLANVLRRMGALADAKALLRNWELAKGRQRLFDGVVFALACLPDSSDEASQVLQILQADTSFPVKDRIRLNALSTSVMLKLRQRTSPLTDAPEGTPPKLRAWLDVVRVHQYLQNGEPVQVELRQTAGMLLLGWAKEKVRQLLTSLASGDDSANDRLFDLEVEALLAA